MIHDIILALGGIGCESLKDVLNEEIYFLAISIHPYEKTILKQLITIADKYKTIVDFIRKVPQFGEEAIVLDDGSELIPGMYLRAFCNGMFDCLKPYRENLEKLEREILADPHKTLTGILAEVSDFQPLLTTLENLIAQIVTHKLHGCNILQLLHEHLFTGIMTIDQSIARMMQRCHLVLLKQLTSWLLYGRLVDPCAEFFIRACDIGQEMLYTSSTTLDSEGPPENLSDGSQQEFMIVQDLVPSYIPPSVPEKARFIGTTVLLFSKAPRSKNSGEDTYLHDSVLTKMESSLLEQLKSLQSSLVLDISSLEQVVEDVRTCVTQHLFSLAKDEADLLGELKLMKELFLLGRGELFVSFLQKASSTLLKPVSNRSGRELSNLLYAAARDVHLNSDVIMEKFTINVSLKDSSAPDTNVWSVMTLEYKAPWPLQLLFTPNVLTSYNNLFNFLLQVKMAELNLHAVWIENVKRKNNPLPQEVWTLRNCLMFLVQNLQCYLQLDVLESEFCAMLSSLDKTQDFEQVIHHHSVFIAHIISQSFLHNSQVDHPNQPAPAKRHPVNKCLVDILRLCDDFCCEVTKSEINSKSIQTISKELDINVAVLMNLIALLGNKASGLRLLLLRLDYNRYFSERTGYDSLCAS